MLLVYMVLNKMLCAMQWWYIQVIILDKNYYNFDDRVLMISSELVYVLRKEINNAE